MMDSHAETYGAMSANVHTRPNDIMQQLTKNGKMAPVGSTKRLNA